MSAISLCLCWWSDMLHTNKINNSDTRLFSKFNPPKRFRDISKSYYDIWKRFRDIPQKDFRICLWCNYFKISWIFFNISWNLFQVSQNLFQISQNDFEVSLKNVILDILKGFLRYLKKIPWYLEKCSKYQKRIQDIIIK